MTFAAGDHLGPYEVIAPIGVGGMREVYRARDTQLNRDVAWKVLPLVFVRDPERLARFRGIVPRAQSRNSTKPAALKSPPNARASAFCERASPRSSLHRRRNTRVHHGVVATEELLTRDPLLFGSPGVWGSDRSRPESRQRWHDQLVASRTSMSLLESGLKLGGPRRRVGATTVGPARDESHDDCESRPKTRCRRRSSIDDVVDRLRLEIVATRHAPQRSESSGGRVWRRSRTYSRISAAFEVFSRNASRSSASSRSSSIMICSRFIVLFIHHYDAVCVSRDFLRTRELR